VEVLVEVPVFVVVKVVVLVDDSVNGLVDSFEDELLLISSLDGVVIVITVLLL
jgi:hypothetical protein